MIDIFDIIKTRKTKRINIEGTVSDSHICPFTLGDLNVLLDIIQNLDENKIEINTLKITSYEEPSLPVTGRIAGMIGEFYSSSRLLTGNQKKDFKIDILLTEQAYDNIYTAFSDFIDYYTVGAIAVDWFKNEWERELTITTDPFEEYMSSVNRRQFDIDFDFLSSNLDVDRLYYRGNEDYSLGSYAINHDADGDILSFMEFDQDFRPTDMSNMFSNMTLSIDLEDRPVITGGGIH